MKRGISARLALITAAILFLALAIAAPAYCQDDGYILLVQQTPLNGGRVSPGLGVLRFPKNDVVTLIATPQPGYQFVYWLGDVEDPTSSTTVLSLDTPKIIIAVFQRAEFELLKEAGLPLSIGPEGMFANYVTLGPYSSAPGAKHPKKYAWPRINPPEPPEEEGDELPVPDDHPIPEPAMMALLGAGWFVIRLCKIGQG